MRLASGVSTGVTATAQTSTQRDAGAIPVPRRCPFQALLVRFCPLQYGERATLKMGVNA